MPTIATIRTPAPGLLGQNLIPSTWGDAMEALLRGQAVTENAQKIEVFSAWSGVTVTLSGQFTFRGEDVSGRIASMTLSHGGAAYQEWQVDWSVAALSAVAGAYGDGDMTAFPDFIADQKVKYRIPNNVEAGFDFSGTDHADHVVARSGARIFAQDGADRIVFKSGPYDAQDWVMVDAGRGSDFVSAAGGRNGPDGATLWGRGGADTLHGSKGDDEIDGARGRDELKGGKGKDDLTGGAGRDSLNGQRGADVLSGGKGADVLRGGGGPDELSGGKGNDRLHGGGGPDMLYGGAHDDKMFGGGHADDLSGSFGNDLLKGGRGGDTLTGGKGRDRLDGQGGNDVLEGGAGRDRLFGGRGDDRLEAGNGVRDRLVGGKGDDKLNAEGRGAILRGGADDDTLGADGPRALLKGGAGDDSLGAEGRSAVLKGGAGADDLFAAKAGARLFGGRGADELYIADGPGLLKGGRGRDELRGAGTLDGGGGADEIELVDEGRATGGRGDDQLTFDAARPAKAPKIKTAILEGGDGDDVLRKSNGREVDDPVELIGGRGNDTLIGDCHVTRDHFDFSRLSETQGVKAGDGFGHDKVEAFRMDLAFFYDGIDGPVRVEATTYDRFILPGSDYTMNYDQRSAAMIISAWDALPENPEDDPAILLGRVEVPLYDGSIRVTRDKVSDLSDASGALVRSYIDGYEFGLGSAIIQNGYDPLDMVA